MRAEFGREGPFPFYAQVAPPSTSDAAAKLIEEHAAAGVDGLILASQGSISAIDFLEQANVVSDLLAAAHAA
jgi:hypothetical protein